eukprot:360820-Chlamydomonas_euryale.AAC.3
MSDHTGTQWVTSFGDTGEAIFGGLKAPEIKALQFDDEAAYSARVTDANANRMVFRLKVSVVPLGFAVLLLCCMSAPSLSAPCPSILSKLSSLTRAGCPCVPYESKVNEDNYNDEQKIRVSVFRVEPMDYVKECRATLDYIAKLEAGLPILRARQDDTAQAASAAAAPSHAYGAPNAYGAAGGGGGAGGYGAPPQRPTQQQYGGGGGGGGWGGPPAPQAGGGYASGPPGAGQGYGSGGGGGYGGQPPTQFGGGAPGGGGGGWGGPPGGQPPPQAYHGAPQQQQGGGYGGGGYGGPPPGTGGYGGPPQQQQPGARPYW